MELYVDSKLYPTHIGADTTITIRVTTKFSLWAANAGSETDINVTL